MDSSFLFDNTESLLIEVFSYIEKNYKKVNYKKKPIGLKEVAEAVNFSPAYLTDLVRQKTGKTVVRWLIERRMKEARRLLLETNESVEKIAGAVGYSDNKYFRNLFRKNHRETPQAWRRKHQGRSILLLQIDLQNASKLIKQRAATMTSEEAQRLQACVQEFNAILFTLEEAQRLQACVQEFMAILLTSEEAQRLQACVEEFMAILLTSKEAQRLQACVEEFMAILLKNPDT